MQFAKKKYVQKSCIIAEALFITWPIKIIDQNKIVILKLNS